MKREEFLFVGVDIHKEQNVAVMMNSFEDVECQISVRNNKSGARELLIKARRVALRLKLTPIFGLEDSYGLGKHLATYLDKKECLVRSVSPVLVDRTGKLETHPEKSDLIDAKGVTKVLIQRIDTLPQFKLGKQDEISKEIKDLVLDRKFLVKERTRLKNQLHSKLFSEFGLAYTEKFKTTFSKEALNYWSENTKNVSLKQRVKRLCYIQEELKEIEKELQSLLNKSGQHLQTLKGCGIAIASEILAELRNIERFSSSAKLAKYSGLVPKERSSGKRMKKVRSKSGNRNLNTAFHKLALMQINKYGSEAAKQYFQRKISEGKTKMQALTCLKRRLVDIVYAMLKTKTSYKYPKDS